MFIGGSLPLMLKLSIRLVLGFWGWRTFWVSYSTFWMLDLGGWKLSLFFGGATCDYFRLAAPLLPYLDELNEAATVWGFFKKAAELIELKKLFIWMTGLTITY